MPVSGLDAEGQRTPAKSLNVGSRDPLKVTIVPDGSISLFGSVSVPERICGLLSTVLGYVRSNPPQKLVRDKIPSQSPSPPRLGRQFECNVCFEPNTNGSKLCLHLNFQ